MGIKILSMGLMFGSPFRIVIFGAGVIVGYLLSENKRNSKRELHTAYDELNDILLEKEGRIDELEDYINQLLEKGGISSQEPAKPESEKKQDLTKIEGIGPKTAEVLNRNGIHTYAQLAATSYDQLQALLAEAGPIYLRHSPETWPKQAQLAASGEWEALKEWQGKE